MTDRQCGCYSGGERSLQKNLVDQKSLTRDCHVHIDIHRRKIYIKHYVCNSSLHDVKAVKNFAIGNSYGGIAVNPHAEMARGHAPCILIILLCFPFVLLCDLQLMII